MSTHTSSAAGTARVRDPLRPRRVIVLGSTGSVGVQTLEVIEHLNTLCDQGRAARRYEIVALAAGSSAGLLAEQARRFGVRDLALRRPGPGPDESGLNLRVGADAARRLVEEVECDLVVGAIVGFAGLDSTLRAAQLGIDIALANKESLVAAGALVIDAARSSGSSILPLDSEHAGVWQCLRALSPSSAEHGAPPKPVPACVSRVVLTASGGALRDRTRDQIMHATLEDALDHPNWDMGAKVTIDSATLMNKALELIEAHWLFGLGAPELDAVIHPQSIVHAMIECADGSVIAQLGAPDMKSPIQHALCFPDRHAACAPRLDVTGMGSLDFIEIDPDRFPAIGLAMRAIEAGGTAGAILNAANEQAVAAFMEGRIEFGRIDELVARATDGLGAEPIGGLDDVRRADASARELVDRLCDKSAGPAR